MSGLWIFAYVALLVVVILMAILLVGTLRRISSLLEQAEATLRLLPSELAPAGLPPGTKVPDFEAPRIDGSIFRAADLYGTSSVVLFVDNDCEPCRELVVDLEQHAIDDLGSRLVVVVDDPSKEESLKAISGVTVLHQVDREVARVFQSSVTPQAFVVDAGGTVVDSGNPNTLDDLRRLAHRAHRGGDDKGKEEPEGIARITG